MLMSASTPAAVSNYGHTQSIHYAALDAEYADAQLSAVVSSYGHEEHVYPVLHYGHTVLMSPSSTPAVVPGRVMSTRALWTHSMLMSHSTPAVVPGTSVA
jgi:hypothetical protein